MELLEVVYEGGEIIDMALEAQRELLKSELRSGFASIDLRRLAEADRRRKLHEVVKRGQSVNNVLIRGLYGAVEAASSFPQSFLLLDALGKTERPADREFAGLAFRTKRIFVYSSEMDQAIRRAGIGRISRHPGPYFPSIRMPTTADDGFTVGVLSFGGKVFEVLAQLKKLREAHNLPMDIVASRIDMPGVSRAVCAMEVAEVSDLLISPVEGEDRWGPDEGAILALCTGRALCTTTSSAFSGLPYSGEETYIRAEKYKLRSYADGVLTYVKKRASLTTWARALTDLKWDTVPLEILRRLS